MAVKRKKKINKIKFPKLSFPQIGILVLVLLVGAYFIIGNSYSKSVKGASTSACKTGVNSFGVDTSCGSGNYRYASYGCYDGTKGRLGGNTSCKPSALWKQYVTDACAGKFSCR